MASAPGIADLLGPIRESPGQSALLLDVDGTLAPIVARPELSALLPGSREILARLRDRLGLVGFVSGRSLVDAERVVGLPGCAYAGNHGLELRHAGGEVVVSPLVLPHLDAIAAFAAAWPEDDLARHGIWVEDKRVSLAFHYRTASQPLAAEAFLAERVAPAAEDAGLRTRPGRRILEVLPRVGVTKGSAVREMIDASAITRAAYAGDDRTDIDAWRAIAALRGEGRLTHAARIAVAGIEVPAEVSAEADVVVEGPHALRAALASLADAIDPSGA